MAMYKGFRVLEKSKPPSPHSVLLEHRGKEETLLFESQAVAVLSLQETEAVKKLYTKILDAYGCLGVLQLNVGDSSVLYLVMITGCFSVGKVGDSEIFRITQTQFIPLHYQQNEERIIESDMCVSCLLNTGILLEGIVKRFMQTFVDTISPQEIVSFVCEFLEP